MLGECGGPGGRWVEFLPSFQSFSRIRVQGLWLLFSGAQRRWATTRCHCINARSFRAGGCWKARELRAESAALSAAQPRLRYLAVNPLGTIPAFLEGRRVDEAGRRRSASTWRRAIRRALDVGVDKPGFRRGPQLPALRRSHADLSASLILRYGRFGAARRRRTPRTLRAGSCRVCALRPGSKPRVPVRGAIHRGRRRGRLRLMLTTDIGLQDRFKPATLAYWRRLQARPGFLRALETPDASRAGTRGVDPSVCVLGQALNRGRARVRHARMR